MRLLCWWKPFWRCEMDTQKISHKVYVPKISQFSKDTFHTSNNMVHESSSNSFIHGRIFFRLDFDIEEFDQRFNGDALNEYRPINHGYGCSDKHISMFHFLQNVQKKIRRFFSKKKNPFEILNLFWSNCSLFFFDINLPYQSIIPRRRLQLLWGLRTSLQIDRR